MTVLSFRTLFRSPTICLDDVHCHSGRSGFCAPEAAHHYTVILPRSGVFVGEIRGRRVVSDANTALFLNPDEPYRVRHPVDGGDRCSNFRIKEGALRDLLHAGGASMAERSQVTFEVSHGPNEPASDLRHRRLLASIARGCSDTLAIEETVLDIVGSVVAAAYRFSTRPRPTRRAGVALRHRRLVERAKEVLATRFCESLQLDDIAAESGCSPYHLCRLFRSHTGMTLHGYRNRLRVRAAQERLDQGARDLARLALELGFSDQSHFSNSFRAETGESPSAFRSIVARRH